MSEAENELAAQNEHDFLELTPDVTVRLSSISAYRMSQTRLTIYLVRGNEIMIPSSSGARWARALLDQALLGKPAPVPPAPAGGH